ncbi:MAG: hypothetical protein IT427_20145, partial [Pirellulales bacterium]|nr:hypothetical protein [Pirellulales bacterium]
IYSDLNDTVYANRFMLSIYASEAGTRNVPLREPMQVTDAYTGQSIANDTDNFIVMLEKGETGMWFLDRVESTNESTGNP